MTDQEKPPADPHRTLKVAGWLFALFALVMVVLGGILVADGRDRDDALRKLETALSDFADARGTARVSSCQQAVDFATAHNALVVRNQDLLRRIFGESSDPDVQAALAEEIAAYDANVVRVRDCSPGGLAAFADGTGGYLP